MGWWCSIISNAKAACARTHLQPFVGGAGHETRKVPNPVDSTLTFTTEDSRLQDGKFQVSS